MRFVLTGPPGGGKTPLLAALVQHGFIGVDEAARAVIAEQRATGGDGLPERDRQRFFDLMLERAVREHAEHPSGIFDRAVPDLIAYAEIFEIDTTPALEASESCRYDNPVFFLPSWREIYTTDEDRRATFEQAAYFGERIYHAYAQLSYAIVEVPRATVEERVRFLMEHMR